MKTTIQPLLVLFLLFANTSFGQDMVKISFDSLSVKQTRKATDFIFPISISVDTSTVSNRDNYFLSVEVDHDKSTISRPEYEFDFKKTALTNLSSKETLFITFKGDKKPDRSRELILNLKIHAADSLPKVNNQGTNRSITIGIEPIKPELMGYEYLGYLGTNFDLVEGIQTKDLFFAANILNTPERTVKKKVGFYLSIYGNRAISRSDSTNLLRLRSPAIDTIDTNTIRVLEESGRALETQTTDNLGAYISPLFQWPFEKVEESKTRLYLAPSLEFVYRRTRLSTSEFKASATDTITVTLPQEDSVMRQRRKRSSFATTQTINEYSFNAGIGLFLVHETDKISVRVHGSVGYASNYFGDFLRTDGNSLKVVQKNDLFFSGRAWITEPRSGVTLQAEVTNSFFEPRPFFVATLSKAFDFMDLGSFFSPITAR